MRALRKTARKTALAGLVLATFGAAGCNSYKYFDIHVRFDSATYDVVSAGRVNSVAITVSGADSSTFNLPTGDCPNRKPASDLLDCGVFEFSTFADSGNLVFTGRAYEGNNQTEMCKSGEGSVMVPVSAETTIMRDLNIPKTGPGCLTQ
jgi:hypothetical protein